MTGPQRTSQSPPNRNLRIYWLMPLLIAISLFCYFLLDLSKRDSPAWSAIAGLASGMAMAAFGIIFFRELRSVTRSEFRIAMTGIPNAGKTVFSTLFFDTLMNERVPGIQFSGEAKTIISVYQAIRNMPSGRWPRKTESGKVSSYSGEIKVGRRLIDFAVGDVAGEYWLDFDRTDADEDPYVEFVISCDAIMHVMPVDVLLGNLSGDYPYVPPNYLQSESQDLALVSRLRAKAKSPIPLVVVISKLDLVLIEEVLAHYHTELFKPMTWENLTTGSSLARRLFHEARTQGVNIEVDLQSFNNRIKDSFSEVHFVFSTVVAVTNSKIVANHGGLLLRWVVTQERDARNRRKPRSLIRP